MYAEKHKDFMLGEGDIFKNCPVPHCYATSDRKLFNFITDYDAILFHGIEMQLNDLPIYRSTHQRYIYFSWESPVSRYVLLSNSYVYKNYNPNLLIFIHIFWELHFLSFFFFFFM